MFYCVITQKFSKPGDKCVKIPIQKRNVVYTATFFDEDTNKDVTVEVGRGWEVVKEVNSTEEGFKLWSELSPSEQVSFAATLT